MQYRIIKKNNLYYPQTRDLSPNPNLVIWSGIEFSAFNLPDKVNVEGTVTSIKAVSEFETLEEARAKMYELAFVPFIVIDRILEN